MIQWITVVFVFMENPNVLTEDIGTSSLAQGPSDHSTLVGIKNLLKNYRLFPYLINQI